MLSESKLNHYSAPSKDLVGLATKSLSMGCIKVSCLAIPSSTVDCNRTGEILQVACKMIN